MLKAKHNCDKKCDICNKRWHDQDNLDADTDETDSIIAIDDTMDLYDYCTFINCNLTCNIDGIYSIYAICQLIYYLYIAEISIIGQFSIIKIGLIVYESILNYIFAQTMQSQMYTIVLIIVSIVWFSIVIIQY